MKICAIRVAETGPFTTPVAVEGFSGGFDVLTRPNETGKSTLFTALATLLGEKHTSTSRTVAALRPDAGGAPLIEADIELGGRVVRLRKRYLASKSAELTELDTGRVWRGADAEGELERRLGGNELRQLRGLVWVPQGASFTLPGQSDKPDKSEAELSAGLAELIEREAADSAGSGLVRRMEAAVKARLGALVTASTQKAKAGSDLFAAVRRRDDIAAALATARAVAATAEARRHRLDALRLEMRSTGDTDRAAALATRAAQAAHAVSEAERARDRLRAADERLKTRELAAEKARGEKTLLDSRIAEADRLAAVIASSRGEIERLEAELTSAEARIKAAEGEHAALAAKTDIWRRRVRRFAALERERVARLANLEADRRLGDARDIAAAITFTEARIAANPASEDALAELQKLTMQLATLEARVAAQAPKISISYRPGMAGRMALDGRALGEGESVRVERAAVIEIEGIGAIRIEPADSGARSPAEERDEVRDLVAGRLAALGAVNLEAAHAGLAMRRRDEATIAAERKRLLALAPHGLDVLHRASDAAAMAADKARAEVDAQSPDSDQTKNPSAADDNPAGSDPATDQAHLSDMERRLTDAVTARHAMQRAMDEIAGRIAVLKSGLATDAARLAEVEAALGPTSERPAVTAAKTSALAEAEAALTEAVRERSAWAETVPSAADCEELIAASAAASAEVARFAKRQRELERDIAEVAGAMRRDGEEGAGADVARLSEALATAEERCVDLQLDVQALQLLATRLERAGEAHRGSVLRPVVDRLQPLLARVLPGASVELDGPLLVARLAREGRADTMTRLSGGTREQVATMVRIAYAQMLAEQSRALPLVLDDALVYSDDVRLEVMIEVLAAAASRHQVVLLSCHERAIAPIATMYGATCLEIEPWAVDSGVARAPRKGRSLTGAAV